MISLILLLSFHFRWYLILIYNKSTWEYFFSMYVYILGTFRKNIIKQKKIGVYIGNLKSTSLNCNNINDQLIRWLMKIRWWQHLSWYLNNTIFSPKRALRSLLTQPSLVGGSVRIEDVVGERAWVLLVVILKCIIIIATMCDFVILKFEFDWKRLVN